MLAHEQANLADTNVLDLILGLGSKAIDLYQTQDAQSRAADIQKQQLALLQAQQQQAARAAAVQQVPGTSPWIWVGMIGGGVLVSGLMLVLLLRK